MCLSIHLVMKSRDILISGYWPRESNPGFRDNLRYSYYAHAKEPFSRQKKKVKSLLPFAERAKILRIFWANFLTFKSTHQAPWGTTACCYGVYLPTRPPHGSCLSALHFLHIPAHHTSITLPTTHTHHPRTGKRRQLDVEGCAAAR